jgi:hypothetical protein
MVWLRCRVVLVRARLATCYFDARALYRFLVLLLLRPDAPRPRCVRARHRACRAIESY